MSTTLGIVVPAYKPDVPRLRKYVQQLEAVLAPAEIRIELDALQPFDSSDVFSDQNVSINVSSNKRGKGAAIMSGFDSIDTDVLVFVDADGSVPASSLGDIVQPIERGVAEVSIGSRRHSDSVITVHQTIGRRCLGDIFAWCAHQVLPTHCQDYQCGAKAISQEAWEDVGNHLYEPGFAWDLEFVSVAGAIGCTIAEVPIVWEDQPGSTVHIHSTVIELARALFNVRRRTTAIAGSPRYVSEPQTDHSVTITNQERQ